MILPIVITPSADYNVHIDRGDVHRGYDLVLIFYKEHDPFLAFNKKISIFRYFNDSEAKILAKEMEDHGNVFIFKKRDSVCRWIEVSEVIYLIIDINGDFFSVAGSKVDLLTVLNVGEYCNI